MPSGPSLWLRVSLLLCCVAVVGILLGAGWESIAASEEEVPEGVWEAQPLPALPESPLWYGGPSEGQRQVVARATAQLPPYPDAVAQALAADYLDPGSRIAVAWFVTRDPPERVLRFYREALLDEGLPVMEHRYHLNAGYVGHVDPASREAHIVSVLAQGGETVVFVSSGQVDSFLEGSSPLPEGLPMPEGAETPVVLAFRQEGRVRYSVQAAVPHARAAELAAFYRETFSTQGWKLEDTVEREAGETHLLASQGDSRISALVQPQEGGARLLLTLDAQEQVQ
ncbi:hypothetical protein [Hyalangium sp.]|uniref:hypothetical protein n=1 Tax=Hyalangium sp. TaxID=2028555 RepID=UPI002D223933|nr:hypothetical protein [Hyalangium sp.]HYH99763.1 hypothetical protein [Hyalangium sp.]